MPLSTMIMLLGLLATADAVNLREGRGVAIQTKKADPEAWKYCPCVTDGPDEGCWSCPCKHDRCTGYTTAFMESSGRDLEMVKEMVKETPTLAQLATGKGSSASGVAIQTKKADCKRPTMEVEHVLRTLEGMSNPKQVLYKYFKMAKTLPKEGQEGLVKKISQKRLVKKMAADPMLAQAMADPEFGAVMQQLFFEQDPTGMMQRYGGDQKMDAFLQEWLANSKVACDDWKYCPCVTDGPDEGCWNCPCKHDRCTGRTTALMKKIGDPMVK